MAQNNNFDVSAHLLIGVTGHRNLHPAEVLGLKEKTRRFFQSLQQSYPDLPLCLLSSLAAGSDQLAAEVALEMGIQVIAPLPIPPEQYLEDFNSIEARDTFKALCRQAKVLIMPLLHGTLMNSIKLPGPERDLQYAQAGIFVSSHCHILLALWDGKESDLLGGTAQVVNFHLHGSMPGPIDRHRAALGLAGMDDETLAYHISVNRQNQQPVDFDAQGRWLSSNHDEIDQTEMPASFDLMFRRHAAFNLDRLKYRNAISQQPIDSPANAECPIHALFGAADYLATMYQNRVRRLQKSGYLFAAILSIAFIFISERNTQSGMPYLFLLVLLAGLVVVSIAKRRVWHEKYIDYRVLAEGLRVQSYWRRAGVVDNNTPSFAHENLLQQQNAELGWIRNVMRTASLDSVLNPIAESEPQVIAVIDEWIGDTEHAGQLRYYSKASENRTRLRNQSEMLGNALLWTGIAVSMVLVIFAQLLQDELQNIMFATLGALSVAAAAHEAYAYKKADKALIKQYRFMQRIFTATRRRLDTCENNDEKRQLLRTLGEAALAEHADWIIMHRKNI